MANVNVWIALRDDAQAQIKARLDWEADDPDTRGDYIGPVSDRHAKLFMRMQDLDSVQRLFRVDTDAGRDWTVWNLYFSASGTVLSFIAAEIADLVATYPNHIRVVGAWHWDGRQVGTQWDITYDAEGNEISRTTTGTPVYPVHPRLLELMPDDVEYDSNGDEISRTRPTVPSDVNILYGQAPRRFS